jgi:hypothetical protein
MIIHYLTLSQRQRETAQALAKKLLHAIPTAQKGEITKSMRAVLNMPFGQATNVAAVMIYDDGADNWRGEVVLDNAGKIVQVGQDCESCEEALGTVKVLLARLKAKESYLAVTDFKRAA